MGEQGLSECNNNGEMLCPICQENNLIIGGTIFMHKDIHKTTRDYQDGHTKNQIDHAIVNKRWRRSLLDMLAKQGADKLKLRKSKRKDQRPPPIDIININIIKQWRIKVI